MNSPSRRLPGGLLQAYPGLCFSPLLTPPGRMQKRPADRSFATPYRCRESGTSRVLRPAPAFEERRERTSCLVRQPGLRVDRCQLLVCHRFYEGDGTSACDPFGLLPCRTHASPLVGLATFSSSIAEGEASWAVRRRVLVLPFANQRTEGHSLRTRSP